MTAQIIAYGLLLEEPQRKTASNGANQSDQFLPFPHRGQRR
ncbi:hypothetical protein ACT496_003758 [Salmonella enterica subsp. diarizonae serovar 21:z10:e,n,x,z15]